MSETYRETRRRVHCLIAAKSMKRKAIGFFAAMQGSSELFFICPRLIYNCQRHLILVPVARAADDAKEGTGLMRLSDSDPCIVVGVGTRFQTELAPKKQILLSKALNAAVAEVLEVISDTEVRIKREFGGDSGKGTIKIRDKIEELRKENISGIGFKILPHIDQQEMYGHVYRCLKDGGCIGIFPEGLRHFKTFMMYNF